MSQMKTPARMLIPYPLKAEWRDAFLTLNPKTTMSISTEVPDATIRMMEKTWSDFTLRTGALGISRDLESQWSFRIGEATGAKPPTPAAGYALRVDRRGIQAVAGDREALIHAWLTVLQLLSPYTMEGAETSFSVPHVEIDDAPALAFRAIHFCIFPETTLNYMERCLKLAALLKFSHIVVEFWGMLKLDALPELAWPQAFSKSDVRPIFDAVRAMGAEIIPMFNHWGHATSSRSIYGRHVVLDQNPNHALLFEPDGWTWCLSNPAAKALLKAVRTELCEIAGSGGFFHIGCDESYSHATCDRCRQRDPVRLFADFINEIAADLKASGRRPIMWGDALLSAKEFVDGRTTATSREDQRTHEAIDTLSRDIVIADWQYHGIKADLPSLDHFLGKGFDVAPAPWWEKQNIEALAKAAVNRRAFGFMQTTWSKLPEVFDMFNQASQYSWNPKIDEAMESILFNPFAKTTMAAFLRKMVPAGGDFSKAGWSAGEVHHDV